jgi:hypothetical protein
MDLLIFSLVLMGFGAFSTYLLATSLPGKVLDAASKQGRFYGIDDETAQPDITPTVFSQNSFV